MQRRCLLFIDKPTVFSASGSVEHGQYLSHTRGWRLRLLDQGKLITLHTDSYKICRKLLLAAQDFDSKKIQSDLEILLRQVMLEIETEVQNI